MPTEKDAFGSVLVTFAAELRLLDDEIPEKISDATIAQAVQDSVGFSGVRVIDVTSWGPSRG